MEHPDMSKQTKLTVMCSYCAARAAEKLQPIPFRVDDESWADLQMHLALTAGQDGRHKLIAFDNYMPGLMDYINELRARLGEEIK